MQAVKWREAAVWGGGLGVLVVLWQLVSAGLGLTSLFVPVATTIELVVLAAALRSARADHSFVQQLVLAVAVAVSAGVLIMGGSMLVTGVLFPELLDATRAEVLGQMQAAGESPERIATVMASIAPGPQAVTGFLGTVATAVVFAPPLAWLVGREA
ncbi:MAG: hypothetical protein ACI8PZ_005069 [Myxococcota bacterium]|jgi:hypothetical protein